MFPEDLAAVLFDAGGTLVHIDYAFVAARAAALGVSVSERSLQHGEAAARRAVDDRAERLGRVEGTDATRIEGYFAAMVGASGVPEEAVQPIVAAMLAGHAESNLWRVPLPGAAETLAALRASGVRTAVVSNGDGRVRSKLAAVGLVSALEFVIDSFEEGVEKPAPEIFRRAVGRLGIAPERAAFIGDIYSIDVVGARAAGLRPILIDPTGGYGAVDCHTISALGELVEGIGAGTAARVRPGQGGP